VASVRKAKKIHIKLPGDVRPLCGQSYPEPNITSIPELLTCCSCRHMAKLRLKTTHANVESFIDSKKL